MLWHFAIISVLVTELYIFGLTGAQVSIKSHRVGIQEQSDTAFLWYWTSSNLSILFSYEGTVHSLLCIS